MRDFKISPNIKCWPARRENTARLYLFLGAVPSRLLTVCYASQHITAFVPILHEVSLLFSSKTAIMIMPYPRTCCALALALAQSHTRDRWLAGSAGGPGWEAGVSPRPTSDTSRQGLVSPALGQATPLHILPMRLNLATISLPSAATDTYEGNSPTGRLQGSLRGRVPNQAFDAATVLDLSLSSSSTPAETASRASRHRALGGPRTGL